jgi:YfiH family protein
VSLVLRSSLLTGYGFRHGFSLRTGGVSEPPFASLNLGRGLGDRLESVIENHARLAVEIGYRPDRLYEVSQVHGAQVVQVAPARAPDEFRVNEADALIAMQADCAIGIRVADCVPILLADPASGAVAAVHAGWRGVVGGVVGAAVHALSVSAGAEPDTLLAAIFPSIGPAAFAIGDDVAAQLTGAAEVACVTYAPEGRAHADLGQAVVAQLARAGLALPRIARTPGCTFSDSARFFSHRRDAGRTGRHLAVIVPRC